MLTEIINHAYLGAMLALFSMARGNATISHLQWLIISTAIIYLETLSFAHTALWMIVIGVVTIRATKPLLVGINRDDSAIMDGLKRNLPFLVVMPFIPLAGILLNQGSIYRACGEWRDNRATRLAEGITGAIIGALI